MTTNDLPPIPRLTTLGDTFTGTVRSCLPKSDPNGYDYVYFTFHGHSGELKIGALGVIAKMMEMGFHDQPDSTNPDGVVRYDLVVDQRLTFSRVGPVRGQNPLWRIVRAAEPVRAPVKPPEGKAPPLTSFTQRDVDSGKVVVRPPPTRQLTSDTTTPEQRRQAARERLDTEAVRIVKELVPKLKKAAGKGTKIVVTLEGIASLASAAVIAMEKRGAA